jgi:hypothetical protein
MADDNGSTRTVDVRPSEDGVEVEADTANGGEIVLIPWAQAVKVARRIIDLARARGDLT